MRRDAVQTTAITTCATNSDDIKRTHYVHNVGIAIEPRNIHWDSYFADISPVADERAGENDARHTVPQGASCKALARRGKVDAGGVHSNTCGP